MAQLLVRSIEDDVKERLRRRAQRHGPSMEEEVRKILLDAVAEDAVPAGPGLGTEIAALFAGLGLGAEFEEWRGHAPRLVEFEE